jgi:hypothetical protein
MTATRCRPPTLRDLSTELTFEVADFCSGSKCEILTASRCFPLCSQRRHTAEKEIDRSPSQAPLAVRDLTRSSDIKLNQQA